MDAGADSGVPDSGPPPVCGPNPSNLTSALSSTSPSSLFSFVSADLNGDGYLDLVAIPDGAELYFDGGIEVFYGLPTGALSEPTVLPLFTIDAATVGDINGDGTPDIVVEWGTQLTAFLNDGHGRLTPVQLIENTYLAELTFTVADLNHDGFPDLVAGVRGNVDPLSKVHASVEVLFGQDSGQLEFPVDIPGVAPSTSPAGLAVGDLNGDGLPDIVGNSNIDPTRLAVLLQQSDGGFVTNLYRPVALGQILLWPNGTPTPDIVVGESGEDLDGGWPARGITFMKNSGHGTFDDIRTVAVSGGGTLVIGDFNGDCVPDLASGGGFDTCESGRQITVLYGDGDGGLGEPQSLPATGDGPWGLATLGPVHGPQSLLVNDPCSNSYTIYGH